MKLGRHVVSRLALLLPAVALAAPGCSTGSSPPRERLAAAGGATSGALEATYELTARGAATYSVPVTVPPGTLGVQPELSLSYNSQARDGVVGLGFALRGIAAVRRCAAVRGIDGFNGSVRLDSDDRFCLGDQRLILVSGGRYGEPGTEYHTAAESWIRVRAEGRCGSGPCSFTATGPDGNSTGFGTTAQARSRVPGRSEVFTWFAETATDRYGNALAVTYTTLEASGEVLPERISYTSNPGLSPPLEARRVVRFEYAERATGTFGDRYRAGLRFRSTKLLSAIVTEIDGDEVLRYALDYEQTARPGRYRLRSIELCGNDGTCLPPTRFAWQQGDPRVESPNSDPGGLLRTGWCTGDGAEPGNADFNGDGRADLTCTIDGTHQVLLSTGVGLISPNSNPQGVVRSGWCTGGETGWSDFDGDGRADIHCDTPGGDHSVLLSTGSGLRSPNSNADGVVRTGWCPARQGSVTCSTSWFNYASSGRSDAVCDCSDGRHFVLLSTGDSLRSASSQPDGLVLSDWCAGGEVTWADFDGDGRSDLHCRDLSRRTLSVMLSTPDGPQPANSNAGGEVVRNWCVDDGDQFGHADFNADLLADAYCHRDGVQRVLLSTGSELLSPTAQPDGTLVTGFCRDGAVLWDDFNGDGLADLQCVARNGDQSVLVSDGTGVVSPTSQPNGLIESRWCSPEEARPGRFDFNGDGLGDFACQQRDGRQSVLIHAPGQVRLLTRAENGLGGTVEWEYGHLAQGEGDWYRRGEDVEYPQVALSSPHPVVRRQQVGDGRGDVIESEYLYADGRVDVDQQVFLGFRSITRVDTAIGRRTETVRALDYPLVGFVEQVTVSGPAEPGGPVVTWQRSRSTPYRREVADNVWFVATTSNEVTSFDSAGRSAFSTATRFEYDAFGNRNLVADLGSPSDPSDDHFSCTVYLDQEEPWRIGFELAAKVTRTEAACRDFLARWPDVEWDPETDLRWSRTEYDDRLSVVEEAAWDDTLSTWITRGYGYDGAGNRDRLVDAAGETWRSVYDETYRSFVVETRTPSDSRGNELVERFRSEPGFGNEVWHEDANGNRFATVYDGLGRERERWGPPPEGGDATMLLATVTHAGDAATGWYVEERHRVTWRQDDPSRWTWERLFVDGLEREWKRRRRSWSDDDVVIEVEYDSQGRPARESFPRFASDPEPRWTSTTYDLLDRPLEVTRADGTVESNRYEEGGLRVITTLAAGTSDARCTVAGYDVRENLLTSEAANGGVQSYRYDPLSQRIFERNPNGVETRYEHDSLGRVTRRQNGDTGVSTQRFDAAARLAEATDGVGTRTTFDYDALGRVTRRASRPVQGAEEVFELSYDDPAFANSRGQLTRVEGPQSVVEQGYDAYERPVTSRQTIAGETHVREAVLSPLDEETRVAIDGGAELRRRLYDDGSLAGLDFRDSADAAFESWAEVSGYTAIAQPTAVAYRNGTTTRYDYYPVRQAPGWLRNWRVEAGAPEGDTETLSNVDYTWNRVGQLTGTEESIDGGEPLSQSYEYDPTGWLIRARGADGNLDYRYDPAGNLTLKDGVEYVMQPDSDRLASASNGLRVTYRDDGTLESLTGTGTSWTYEYDPTARLQRVVHDGETVMTAFYDAEGRRLQRTDADGSVSRYFFDDWGTQTVGGQTSATFYLTGNDELVATVTRELEPTGAERAAALAAAASLYRWGSGAWWKARARAAVARLGAFSPRPQSVEAGLVGLALVAGLAALLLGCGAPRRLGRRLVAAGLVAALLAVPLPVSGDLGEGGGLPQPGVLYFHQNVVDSVSFTTGPAGARSSRVAYRPYGELDEPRSDGPDDFRSKFTGQERDADSGLYDYGQRYYHPGLGRFLQPDPEEQFVSPYTYVGNNPLSAVDPDGTLATLVAVLIGVAVVGALTGAYFGTAAANDDYNPAHWDWTSGKTWGGLVAGAVIGAVGAVLGVAAWAAGPAVGIAADILLGAAENLFFTALTTTDPADLALAAVSGAVFGGLFAAGGVAVSRGASALSRGARRAFSSARRGATRSTSGSAFGTLALHGGERGSGRTVRRAGSRPVARGCSSFPAGVPVAGADGELLVESIAVGQKVLSLADPRDAADDRGQGRRVLSLLSRKVAELTVVQLPREALRTTPEHPFWTLDRGWVPAAALRSGDRLLDADGDPVGVLAVERVPGPATVFNFQVAGSETYYVGVSRVLVHNPKCRLSKLPPTKTMTTARQRKLWQNKTRTLAREFGNRQVWYKDPAKGRRWLDLSSYAVTIKGKRARVSLSSFGKGSTRSQHFSFADRRFGVKKGRVIYKVKYTWHHHPARKQMDLVPYELHRKLGHEGSFKHLF